MTPQKLHVGICGAGLGGLAASIAIARAGARVTVLEAAAELGEIGAGIQMTPNVSRLLIKWGVSDIIGDDLVQCDEINMRSARDGNLIQHTELVPKTLREFGFPWWVVHRHHLHTGLSEAARRHGVTFLVDSKVDKVEYQDGPVKVTTEKGKNHTFDLFIGADGLKSVVRKTLFPSVKPRPPTTYAAYRGIIPFADVFKEIPETKELLGNAIDIWVGGGGYIIAYPISGGKDLNLVMAHHRDNLVEDVEEVDMNEMRDFYKGYDPRIRKILAMVPHTYRWPLLVTGPLESWSSPQKNVVLMGDAAHSMVNHLAQGAATSMEDGAFLGRVLTEVIRGILTLPEAIHIYEKTRMPRAWIKQQVSFTNGVVSQMPYGPAQEARDASSAASVSTRSARHGHAKKVEDKMGLNVVTGPDGNARSWNLWGAPETVQSVYGYDAEGDADQAVLVYLMGKGPVDGTTKVAEGLERKWTGWFLPKEEAGRIGTSKM